MGVKKITRIVLWLLMSLSTIVIAQEPTTISETEMALGYYQPLAEQGEPYAQLTIGEIYMEGTGVDQNLVQAYAWFAVAVHQGVDEAEEIMNQIFSKLSKADQLEARAYAAQYIQQFSPH